MGTARSGDDDVSRERELAELIVSALNLEVAAADIDAFDFAFV